MQYKMQLLKCINAKMQKCITKNIKMNNNLETLEVAFSQSLGDHGWHTRWICWSRHRSVHLHQEVFDLN